MMEPGGQGQSESRTINKLTEKGKALQFPFPLERNVKNLLESLEGIGEHKEAFSKFLRIGGNIWISRDNVLQRDTAAQLHGHPEDAGYIIGSLPNNAIVFDSESMTLVDVPLNEDHRKKTIEIAREIAAKEGVNVVNTREELWELTKKD